MRPPSPEQPPAPSIETADAPLTDKWVKPYPFGLTALVFLVMATAGMVFLGIFGFATVRILITADRTGLAPVTTSLPFIIAWEIIAWRIQRTALHVSTTGIRVRGFLDTRRFAWSRVQGFRSAPTTHGDAQIVIDLDDGTHVRAPVRYRSPRYGRRSTTGGPNFNAAEYARTLARLERIRSSATR